MITADGQQEEWKRNPRFVVPGKENILCWDCNYYGHRRGHKVCPNYNPSRWSNSQTGKGEQVNVTTGDGGRARGTNQSAISELEVTVQNTEILSLTGCGPEVTGQQKDAQNET